MKKEITWINTARTLCIIAIYLRHSEIYYEMTDTTSLFTSLFTPFRVVIFFFISGYLFFGKQFSDTQGHNTVQQRLSAYTASLRHLMFRLAIPTILFATLIYVPKIIFHGDSFSTKQYLYDVWGGTSYWFTSALTVAQVILLTALCIKKTDIRWYLLLSAILMGLGIWFGRHFPTPFPWYWQSAFVATFFLTLGGCYRQYETKVDRYMKTTVIIILSLIYIMIATYYKDGFNAMIAPVQLDGVGFVTIILGIIFIIGCSKWLPRLKGLDYIGKHSITFYFLSGVMPALFATIAHKLSPTIIPYIYSIVAVLSLLGASIATYVIGRYLPFLLDLRRLKRD